MSAFLGLAGVSHFAAPAIYDPLVPAQLPGSARFWTQASGVAEVAVAASLLRRSTARAGSWAALGLFVAVYPANIKDTVDHWPPKSARGVGSLLRLPLQFPLFAWAWRLAHAL